MNPLIQNPSQPIHIISLGAGVQSSTMALMAAAGEITPMPVAAIFSDTQAEPKNVYTWLDWLEKQLPFPVVRVSAGNLRDDILTPYWSNKNQKHTFESIPAYILNDDGTAPPKKNAVNSTCSTTNAKECVVYEAALRIPGRRSTVALK